jgi:DHA1 family bicyclomycin/chloramphenicol resistance-like MFS transporter
MTSAPASEEAAPRARLPLPEFVALIAMLFSMIALAIDAMLPALPAIAADLAPDAPGRGQLIVLAFVLGMGVGTFVVGPLSDAFGRRRIILGGVILYALGALWAGLSSEIEFVLAARLVQGLGAAGPRIVSLAMLRDLYSGRQMARIASLAMLVFTLVPAVAPAIGATIMAFFHWRAIFLSFVLFALVAGSWFALRQPETLPAEMRKPLSAVALWGSLREVLSHRTVQLAIAAQSLLFGALFGTLANIQPLFEHTYGRGASFPAWFALIALLAGSASMVNAALVVRLGMRRMVLATTAAQAVFSSLLVLLWIGGAMPAAAAFAVFILWVTGVFFMAGLTLGNLNALALEPMGHVAGMAASVTSSVATVASVMIAAPWGLTIDGSPVPLALGVALLSAGAFAIARRIGA